MVVVEKHIWHKRTHFNFELGNFKDYGFYFCIGLSLPFKFKPFIDRFFRFNKKKPIFGSYLAIGSAIDYDFWFHFDIWRLRKK